MFHVKQDDNIFALSTPRGSGAIAVIRISGYNLYELLQGKLFNKRIDAGKTNYVSLYVDGNIIDKALVLYFKSPHSYTGEDVIELHVHNSQYIISEIENYLEKLGFRYAEPGEFTKRAVLNNKLTIEQAEAINSLIGSTNRITHKQFLNILFGKKKFDSLENIKNKIERLFYTYSASIDFVEHENDYFGEINLENELQEIKNVIERNIDIINKFIMLDKGIDVVIVGIPNSGKSSLFNLLLQENRAIVHNTEGTTRDFIDADIMLDGFKLKLYDTAGIRDNPDEIESIGIRKTYSLIEDKYYILFVIDTTKDIEQQKNLMKDFYGTKKIIEIYNKKDISNFQHEHSISCNNEYYNKVLEIIKKEIINDFTNFSEDYFAFNVRHLNILKAAYKTINELLLNYSNYSEDIIYFYLSMLLNNFNDLYNEHYDSEKYLDNIFKNFCIGK